MKFFSPAKLNYFFRVLSKRDDGYHEIASLYQAIDVGDDLILKHHHEDLLTCSDPNLACDASNLVIRALNLFRQSFSCPHVHIHLVKRIPQQAGLGGGSSNAATTLWALNQFSGTPATDTQLIHLASQIGSDVPFFFSSGTAYCTGRGEIMKPASITPVSGWLAKPAFGLSTPAVYHETRIDELRKTDPEKCLASFQTEKPFYQNDLEPAAIRLEPNLALFKELLLSSGFHTVTMTGSGSAFFCLGLPDIPIPSLIPFNSCLRRDSWYV
jgi:4-diphosphocytidyl-2-C-methyl-D-erythritol kinase